MNNQFRRYSRDQALGQAGGPTTRTMPRKQFIEDWWVEPLNFLALAGGAVANGNIVVQADSAFKLTKLGFFADIAVATQTESTRVIPLVTIQITDTGSGRNLFANPVAIPALFGIGPLPHILPVPRLFLPRSNIAVTVTNLTVATTYNLRLAFEGSKIFKLSGAWEEYD